MARGGKDAKTQEVRRRIRMPRRGDGPMVTPQTIPRALRPHLPRTSIEQASGEHSPYQLMKSGLLTGAGALLVAAASQLPDALPWRTYDPHAGEKMRYLGADRGEVLAMADGTPLSVREVGPLNAPLTVVFSHGYTLTKETFHFQATRLKARFGDDIRMIFYDQRGHGSSAKAKKRTYTIDQLARDLHQVITSVAPEGPVVLVGHSMGGMTVQKFAALYPEFVAERVVGVGLLSTAASNLPDAGLPALLDNAAIGSLTWVVDKAPGVFRGGRRALAGIIEPLLKAGSFGDPTVVGPTIIDFTNGIISATDVEVMAAFVDSLVTYDATAAFEALQNVTATIVVGDADLLTPLNRSVEIAQGLPHARFVVVPGAGHMIQFEAIEEVNKELSWLITTAFAEIGIEPTSDTGEW